MAVLDLGDVTFGLAADTEGLQRSRQKLEQFGRLIDQTARSQEAGAQKVVNALARQEDKIAEGLETVRQMRTDLLKIGGPDVQEAIRRNTVALRRFTRGMSAANLPLKDQLRLQRNFARTLRRSGAELRNLKTGRAAKGLGRMTEVMRDLESASVLAVGPLSGIGARIRALGAIANRSTLLIVGLIAGVTGLVVVLVKLFSASVRARVQMDKITGAMQQATGAAVFARNEFKFVLEVANRMGQNVAVAAESFAQFAAAARGTKVEGEGVRTVFEGVLTAVTALKLPTETQTGLFRALIQMMSKGVIQSEELRGQFGERLAGGFEIVRKKIGATRTEFAKLLKDGKLIAEEFLIPIGEALKETFGEQAVKSSNTFINAVNRMSNAQFLFNIRLDDMINASGVAKGAVDLLTGAINILGKNLDTVLASILAVLAGLLVFSGPSILKGFQLLIGLIKKLAIGMAGLNAVMAANPFLGIASLVARIALAAGAAAGAFLLLEAAFNDAGKASRRLIEDVDELLTLERLRTKEQQKVTRENLALLGLEVEALKLKLLVEKKLIDSAMVLGAIMGADTEPTTGGDQAETLINQIDVLGEKIKGLEALLAKGLVPFGDDALEVSKKLQKAIDKVRDLGKELSRSKIQIDNIGKDVKLDPDFLDAVFEAEDLLEDLTEAAQKEAKRTGKAFEAILTTTLEPLEAKLKELGFSGEALENVFIKLREQGFDGIGLSPIIEVLTQLIFTTQQAEDKWKELLKAFEKSPKIVKELTTDIDRMRLMIEALGSGSKAIEELNKQFEREDALEAYKEQLKKLTEEARKSLLTIEQFADLLKKLEEQEEKFETVVKPLEDAFKSAFDRIGDSIVDAFEKGAVSLRSLKDLANEVFKEIFKAILEITLINPIKDVISGGAGGFGSLFGGLLFSGATAAKGLAFESGRARMLGKGGILDGPTVFPTSSGIAIGGEAGTEAVIPLARTSTGDLGVKLTGQQGPMTFNFIFPANMNVREFNRSRSQLALIARDVAGIGSGNM